MKTKLFTILVGLVLGFFGIARADIVELNLFDLGCPTEFNWDSPYWQADFDLGIEFLEIDSVYMDLSGEITAEIVAPAVQPDNTMPIDALFMATLYESNPHDYFGRAHVQAGQATYPSPEPFDLQVEFSNGDLSELLDGKSNIEIGLYRISRPGDLITIEYPSGRLDSAMLVLEGTLIPEPASILLFAIGTFWVRLRKCKTETF